MTEESFQITNDDDGNVSPEQQEQPLQHSFLSLTEDEDGGFERELQAEGQREKDEQKRLRDEAQPELEALRKLNFDVDANNPKDIRPYHVEIWRMQRLAAEGNLKELGNLLRSEKGAPRWVGEFFDDPDIPDTEKIELIEARLPRILEYKKQAYEATRAPTVSEIKAQIEAEQQQKNLDEIALVDGRSLAEIEAEIKQLESSPEYLKMFDSRNYIKTANPLHDEIIEKRDSLYRAAEAARQQGDSSDNSFHSKFGRHDSNYKPGKYGR